MSAMKKEASPIDLLFGGREKDFFEKHQQEVQDQVKKLLNENKKLLKTLSIDSENYSKKLYTLCQRWTGSYNANTHSDSNENRIAYEILDAQEKNPLGVSIVLNDLNIFKKHEKIAYYLYPGIDCWLEGACLLGSETIANYILNNYFDKVASITINNILRYALASRNYPLVFDVAKILKIHNKPINPLYARVEDDIPVIEKLEKMFSNHERSSEFDSQNNR